MEQVNVKLTPSDSSNPIVTRVTSNPQLILADIEHDSYALEITSDFYKSYTTNVVIDGDTVLNIHLEALVTQQIEWRPKSKVTTIPITTTYIDDSTLDVGIEIVESDGVLGKITETWEAEYVNNVATGATRNSNTTTVNMVQREVRRGTKVEIVEILTQGSVAVTHSTNTYVNNVRTANDSVPIDGTIFEIRQWENPSGALNIMDSDLVASSPYTLAMEFENVGTAITTAKFVIGLSFFGGKHFFNGTEVSIPPAMGEYDFKSHMPASGKVQYHFQFTTEEETPVEDYFQVAFHNASKNTIVRFSKLAIYQGHINPFGESVKKYGAMGDGVTNDTLAIAQALSEHNVINIPSGVYMIDADVSLKPRSHTKIYMSSDTVLKTITNSSTHYELFDIIDKEDITISGGTLVGDRNTHQGTEGEWGHGINMRGAKDITIQNLKSQDFWGDGIYLGISVATGNTNRNIKLKNVHADNNRRQGLSVVTVDGLYGEDVTLSNTNGTLPQAGVDFEPNNNNEPMNNIHFDNLKTYGNAGDGILFHFANLTRNDHKINATFNNFKSDGDRLGINFDKFNGEAQGAVTFNNPEIKNSKVRGIGARGFSSKFSKITLNNPIVENSNRDGLSSVAEGGPISVFRSSADYPEDLDFTMGNIEINNPQISFTGGVNPLQYDIVFWSGTGNTEKQFEKIDIKNVSHRMIFGVQNLRNSNVDTDEINYIYDYWAGTSPVEFNLPENNRVTPVIKLVNNKQCTVRLNSAPNDDYPYEFIVEHVGNSGTYPMYIRPPAGETMNPVSYTNGLMVPASASGSGSKVKLGRENGKWKVIEVTGSWVAI